MSDNDTPITTNMRIWDQVHDVPVEVTKKFLPKGETDPNKMLTAIAPVWYFEEATKMWGPLGIGWGFTVEDDTIISDSKSQPILHVIQIKLWYDHPPRSATDEGVVSLRHSTYGVGCTQMQYVDSGGKSHWDDDFNKKTLTDAITNALSRLGFGADIRKRSYEGSKYVGPAGAQGEHDPDMTAAWDEYITWARKTYADVAATMTDMQLCARAAKKLTDHQRQITPDNVRGLIVEPE